MRATGLNCVLMAGWCVAHPRVAAAQAPQAPPRSTSAQPSTADPQYPRVSIGTLTYLQYGAELEGREGFNAFDVTRGYINITGDLAKNIKFRLTPDLKRTTDGNLAGSLTFRLKYGFVEFDNLTPRSWLRLGLHQTPWLDFEEAINRYRVQGTMFAEREGLIPGSADFGAGYLTQLPSDYGELQVGIYNGEGFTQAEANKFKSVQGRLTIRPFPGRGGVKGLRVSAFYDLGWYAKDQPRRHGIVMGSFESQKVVAIWQWVTATERPAAALARDIDRSGYSGFLEAREGLEGWAGFVRFDRFDPDRAASDNSYRRIIAGVAHWLVWSRVRVGLVVNDEDVRYDAGAGRPAENRLLVQTHVQF